MIAFHGTMAVDEVLATGLQPRSRFGGCEHVCLAEHPYFVAMFGTVLMVDTTGLPVWWEEGEGRIHEPIEPSRIEVMDPQPECIHWSGWTDPALRYNHAACLARRAA